jgi:hypothetical protein
MSGILLLALAMVNVPVYLLLGRRLFGTWERFLQSVRLWLTTGTLNGPSDLVTEGVSTDTRLGILFAGSAAVILVEFFLLAQFVFHLPV